MNVAVETCAPSGYTSLPESLNLEDRTGQVQTLFDPCGSMGGISSVAAATSAGQTAWAIGALVGTLLAPGSSSITGYTPPLLIEPPAYALVAAGSGSDPETSLVVKLRRAESPNARKAALETTTVSAAEELRESSGLQTGKLAHLFGVSRATFYNWMQGATPRDLRFQHLGEVLAHVREARRRLPTSTDLPLWLQTPIAAGGRTPLDFLREKKFSTFRGLLVRVASAEMGFSLPRASVISHPMGRDEIRLARERLNPSPRPSTTDEGTGDP